MKSRAAVAFAAGEPLKIVEIDVAPPQKGEVLVRITHTGVCHTDAFTLSGDDPEGLWKHHGHQRPGRTHPKRTGGLNLPLRHSLDARPDGFSNVGGRNHNQRD